MEKLRPKAGNPLEFNIWFLFIYLLLFIPDVSDNIKSHFFWWWDSNPQHVDDFHGGI